MNDNFLRKAASAAVHGQQIIEEGLAHVAAIKAEVESGAYAFTELPSPSGSRALQALNEKGNCLMVCQFNHVTDGIRHAGTAVRTTVRGPMIINLPPDIAEFVYHWAATRRNTDMEVKRSVTNKRAARRKRAAPFQPD